MVLARHVAGLSRSFVTPEAALALVVGANLGSAITPMLEGGQAGDPASRRLPLGNLHHESGGLRPGTAVPASNRGRASALSSPTPRAWRRISISAFNAAIALLFIFPLDRVAAWLTRAACRRPRSPTIPRMPIYLDEASLSMPPGRLGMRGARGPAHGRRGRNHAQPVDGRPHEQRPQARRRRSAGWTTSPTAWTKR